MPSYLQPNMKRSELDFFERREILKESIRKKTQSGNDVAIQSESGQRKRKLPYNDFGSFFGPSQPAIASRVLQTSKSPLEKEQSAAKKSSSPTTDSETKNAKEPVKSKAEKLKDARDYSFLLSDDAELPVSITEPPSNSKPSSKENQVHTRPASSGNQMCSSTIPQARTKEASQTRPSISKDGASSSRLSAPTRKPMDQRRKLGPPHQNFPRKERVVEQRKVSQKPTRSQQMVPRKSVEHKEVTRSKMVPRKPQPVNQSTQILKKKKKPEIRTEEDELAMQMIRKICGSDRFAGRHDDYDDPNMEATFDDILKEEKRSERLGKKEDAEQLKLIEEEERKRKKKQKLT